MCFLAGRREALCFYVCDCSWEHVYWNESRQKPSHYIIICRRMLLFSSKYVVLLPAAVLKRDFPPQAPCNASRAADDTGHTKGDGWRCSRYIWICLTVKRHSKVPTFGQEIPRIFLNLPDLVSEIYYSGITVFSSTCMYSRSL